MRYLKKVGVISVISIFILSGATPAFCSSWGTSTPTATPTPTPTTPAVDGQKFVPETPQQRINKANEDTLRYQQQVPPPGGAVDKKKESPAKPPATSP
jgi:hypothetical protein